MFLSKTTGSCGFWTLGYCPPSLGNSDYVPGLRPGLALRLGLRSKTCGFWTLGHCSPSGNLGYVPGLRLGLTLRLELRFKNLWILDFGSSPSPPRQEILAMCLGLGLGLSLGLSLGLCLGLGLGLSLGLSLDLGLDSKICGFLDFESPPTRQEILAKCLSMMDIFQLLGYARPAF
jgi:hypothetical protein